ncbi:S8 family serine peptidase [Nocardioides sp. TRM66260-LWL]|uniref:S8 family serine peptidase n=1 Tax=Nocardioides sp. TRM66260-LWL TaxID=2874478 RepID=UPI001CC7E4C5|nr:S8 family serine peptidase [Nocardioides sp. TRM66260-LWL]MBZ5734549.1 S8 family serine peptidase [Nocardioides sp. TRM66260-LWL]
MRRRLAGVALACALAPLAPASPAPAARAAVVVGVGVGVGVGVEAPRLHLVSLDRPGTAGPAALLPEAFRSVGLVAEQDAVLAAVDAPPPVYRWTTALDGVAVRLTPDQAAALAADPRVAAVEPDVRRRLTAAPVPSAAAGGAERTSDDGGGRPGAGRGVVVGVVDSGLDADDPLFASVPGLGPRADPIGDCRASEDGAWDPSDCTGKVVGGRFFVAGFGAARVRSGASLSPADDAGHGTAVASLIAGNADTPVRLPHARTTRFSGRAPLARLAAYKACWTAPDPADDGCSTADLVSAVDAAVSDGVDVLAVPVAGPPARPATAEGLDALDRALLGATEDGVVVVASAGNGGAGRDAAHAVPWVLSVGASTGTVRRGRVVASLDARGPLRLAGVMTATDGVGPARLVAGRRAAAAGVRPGDAAGCRPGSLDARRVRGRIVVCERGRAGRVDLSAEVAAAGGVGMVLVNETASQPLESDLHAVPTVHVGARDGRRLLRRLARAGGEGEARLESTGAETTRPRVLPLSASGDPGWPLVKPDLVAPGAGVLAASGRRDPRWTYLAGTSAATAAVAGEAAVLLSRHLPAAVVRSSLVTTARPVAGAPVTRAGAGVLDPERAARPGLALLVPRDGYRRWLEGGADVNVPSIGLQGSRTARRTVTNVTRRSLYFSSSAGGFDRHRVVVRPAALRLAPGESATFTVRVAAGSGRDDGYVLWRGATGTRTRLPVTIGR